MTYHSRGSNLNIDRKQRQDNITVAFLFHGPCLLGGYLAYAVVFCYDKHSYKGICHE